jgi:hypothetical protein
MTTWHKRVARAQERDRNLRCGKQHALVSDVDGRSFAASVIEDVERYDQPAAGAVFAERTISEVVCPHEAHAVRGDVAATSETHHVRSCKAVHWLPRVRIVDDERTDLAIHGHG